MRTAPVELLTQAETTVAVGAAMADATSRRAAASAAADLREDMETSGNKGEFLMGRSERSPHRPGSAEPSAERAPKLTSFAARLPEVLTFGWMGRGG